MIFDGDKVIKFAEKPKIDESWINGGFFILEPEVLNYIEGNDTQTIIISKKSTRNLGMAF